MTDEQIAAKIWHTLYPKSTFYYTKKASDHESRRRFIQAVGELRKQGIIIG